jgi:hypothetical protein
VGENLRGTEEKILDFVCFTADREKRMRKPAELSD